MAHNSSLSDPIGTTLLFAVSDVGDATREQFQDWCNTLGVSHSWSLRRSLDRLGHIDLFSGERKELSAGPAALVEGAPDYNGGILAFVAGRRDPATVDGVRQAADILGVSFGLERQDPAPERVTLRSDSRATLRRLAELCRLSWAGPAALKLARSLRQPLLTTALPADRLEHALWFSCSRPLEFSLETRPPDTAALCQVQQRFGPRRFGPRRYFLAVGNDAWPVDRKAGLHALATLLKIDNVVTYEPSEHVLRVRQEFPLPRLHERAAVLCTGLEPAFSSGWYRYPGVDVEVASQIESMRHPLKEIS